MIRFFISQPMNGKTDEEIQAIRDKVIYSIKLKYGEDSEIIDTYIDEDAPENSNPGVWYLGESIKRLADADVICMVDGWESARGCIIEHSVAREYGLRILYLSK